MKSEGKFALLGDTHFGCRSDSISHMEYIKNFFNDVFFPRLEKENIKTIFQLGDFMDRRKFVNYHTLSLLKEAFLDRTVELGIQVYVLVGNHDIYWKDSVRLNSVSQLFGQYENLICIDQPTKVNLFDLSIDIIPWICKDNQKQIFDFIKDSKSDILLGHLELSGFPMYKGISAEHGMDISPFKKYQQVFTGHYHTHSVDHNIEYLGTPYEITWSDCNDTKGFGIYNVETRINEFVFNPLRIFRKINYNDELFDYKQFDFSMYKKSHVKIIVEKRANEKMFDEFIENLYEQAEPLNVTISDLTNSFNEPDVQNIEAQDPLTVLVNSVDDQMQDSKEIRKLIMDIYSEVLQNQSKV